MTEPYDGADAGSQQEPGPGSHPEVGSLGEEAAKLMGALSELAHGRPDVPGDPAPDGPTADDPAASDAAGGAGRSEGLHGLAGHAAEALRGVDEHLATGAPECAYCPICRTVHVVRQASPEVRAHLTSAASSLLQAMAGVLAAVPASQPAQGGGTAAGDQRGGGFERIDLDTDPGTDPETGLDTGPDGGEQS